MTVTELNPTWLDPDRYIEFLNRGFRGQWDRASYDFYLRRSFAGKPTDIGVRAVGSEVLSGVSFCYRQLRVASDAPLDVCIMSAGTTLPAERGRGHYAQLLRTGLELCRARSCAAILGFVTRENASGRGLMRLGAYSIPSFYMASRSNRAARRPAAPQRIAHIARSTALGMRFEHVADAGWIRRFEASSQQVRLHYPRAEDWLQQFVQRPNPVRMLRLAHDALALIETVGTTDRLQWLGCPDDKRIACVAMLAACSAGAGRQFFMYTLDPLLAAAAQRCGLTLRGGRLMLLPLDHDAADWAKIAAAPWRLHSGDRM